MKSARSFSDHWNRLISGVESSHHLGEDRFHGSENPAICAGIFDATANDGASRYGLPVTSMRWRGRGQFHRCDRGDNVHEGDVNLTNDPGRATGHCTIVRS